MPQLCRQLSEKDFGVTSTNTGLGGWIGKIRCFFVHVEDTLAVIRAPCLAFSMLGSTRGTLV